MVIIALLYIFLAWLVFFRFKGIVPGDVEICEAVVTG